MKNLILEVKNLTKQFGTYTAVNNLSFDIAEGEVLGLLGPNGAGKTTTIHMLLGVSSSTRGSIKYFGKNLYKNREEILKQINYSSTYISMPWTFTIAEILDTFARLYEIPDKNKRIKKLLAEFEIDHLSNRQYNKLSAGEKTRLFLTKAFLNYPKLILLDEPTASLDPDIAVKIRKFLKKEKEEYNVSMLFTSHNMSEVEEMCDRVIILKSGKSIAEDTPSSLARQMRNCVVELLILDDKEALIFFENRGIRFEKDDKVFRFYIDEKDIAKFLIDLSEQKIDYHEISINKPDLEDYFLQVIKENYELE